MTPAERDEVRRRASDRLVNHSMATVTSNERCPCDRCDDDRAILRYVPPGNASDPSVASAERSRSTPYVLSAASGVLDPSEARRLAHAIHAAADAAEETTR